MVLFRQWGWLALSSLLLPVPALALPFPPHITPVSTFQLANRLVTFTSPASFPIPFTIQHPADWVVDSTPQNFIIITNYQPSAAQTEFAPAQAVKTDITFTNASFEAVVRSSQRSRLEDDSRVIRQGFLKAGGREGLRLWTTDSSFGFPDGMTTYYRYSNTQTIAIYTYYTASNTAAVPIIQQIHGSFRVVNR